MWMKTKNFKKGFEIVIGCYRLKDVRKFLGMGKEVQKWA